MWRAVAVLAFVAQCYSLPAQDTAHSENELELTDCLIKDSTTCLKYKFFSYVDKMIGHKENFTISDGITVVRATDVPVETGAPRSMDLLTRLKNYLGSHTLRIEVKGSDVVDAVTSTGRALEVAVFSEENEIEGRGKKKKVIRMLGPLLMALMAKKIMLMKLAIGVIALIAGKALLIGKIALVLSAIIGLKKLMSQEKHVTYEVVAHPQHSSSHEHGGSSSSYVEESPGGHGGGGIHGGSSWGRSIDPHSLAYAAQKPLESRDTF